MRLNIKQQTKDGEYVTPYLIEGKTVYCADNITKKISDFYDSPLEDNIRIITVSKNDDTIFEETPEDDGLFIEEENVEKDMTTYTQDDVMNIEVTTEPEPITIVDENLVVTPPEPEPIPEPEPTKSTITFIESDDSDPYSDDF